MTTYIPTRSHTEAVMLGYGLSGWIARRVYHTTGPNVQVAHECGTLGMYNEIWVDSWWDFLSYLLSFSDELYIVIAFGHFDSVMLSTGLVTGDYYDEREG